MKLTLVYFPLLLFLFPSLFEHECKYEMRIEKLKRRKNVRYSEWLEAGRVSGVKGKNDLIRFHRDYAQ